MTRTKKILLAFAETAPAIIRANFTPGCCLNATRCFVEAVKAFDLRATPVVVETIAFNKEWEQQLRQNGGEWPRDAEEKRRFMNAGGYSIAVGGEHDANGWPHHIVAVVGGRLVDASAGQMSRPDHDLTIPQVVVLQIPAGFLTAPQFAVNQNEDGVTIGYKATPGVPYEHLPGWQLSPHNLRATEEMVAAIRSKL